MVLLMRASTFHIDYASANAFKAELFIEPIFTCKAYMIVKLMR